MHWDLTQDDDMNPETDVTYGTRNLFSDTKNRFLYFISDVPHLLKTAPNCLSNGMEVCLYYGTILLTYFMKIKNVDFIYFQNYA